MEVFSWLGLCILFNLLLAHVQLQTTGYILG